MVKWSEVPPFLKVLFTYAAIKHLVPWYLSIWVRSFPHQFLQYPAAMTRMWMTLKEVKHSAGFYEHIKAELVTKQAGHRSLFLRNLLRLVNTIEHRIESFPPTADGNSRRKTLKKEQKTIGAMIIALALHVHQKIERDGEDEETALNQAPVWPSKMLVSFKASQMMSLPAWKEDPDHQLNTIKDLGYDPHIDGKTIEINGVSYLPYCVSKKLRQESVERVPGRGVLTKITRTPTFFEL